MITALSERSISRGAGAAVECGCVDGFSTEQLALLVGKLQEMVAKIPVEERGSPVGPLALCTLHRLEWILCQRNPQTCSGVTDLRARCLAAQECCLRIGDSAE